MPNCVVKGCKNCSTRDKKQHGITYHAFPVLDQIMREKWITIIRNSRNEPLWVPTSHSLICSAHFDSNDFYYTKKKLRRLTRTGYPKILPNQPLPSLNRPSISSAVSQVQNAASDTKTDDPFADLNQPITSSAVQDAASDTRTDHPFTDLNQSATSSTVQDAASDNETEQPFPDLDWPNTPGTVQPVMLEQDPLCDTTINHKLQKRITILQKKLTESKKKVKILHQKVRRLHTRNKSLKEKLNNFKNQIKIENKE